ncbi:Peptidase M24A, methionine aminopeptidase, subfamily 2 [mine drainage metagenome]|uniref:Peptidase M24A, methionine aminopeptidase, subfamily 2 n=2 Tax=mine drainage metagenome TaxID=410659 RepID=T1B2M1_9ZZZZ
MRIPDADLPRWREASRIASRARDLGLRLLVPGVRRRDVADTIEAAIRDAGAQPSFPVNLSRNEEAAHYSPAPDDRATFEVGDLVKVDVGAHLDGAIADTADTVEVGGGARHAHLIRAVHDALRDGIAAVRPGGPVDRVSAAIAAAIRGLGLRPVEDLTGHSIEPYLLHGGKSVPNVPGRTTALFEEGEIVAIEPFATNGIGRIANGPFGHIQRFRTDPGPADPVLAGLFARFRTLPFTLRWVAAPEEREALRRARRYLQTYPVFLESGHGLVAQAEHTILVGPTGAEVLSAPLPP